MSKIEWTEQTWNPIIGCRHTSPGCDNCYAERMACRLAHMPLTKYYRTILRPHTPVGQPEPTPTGWDGTARFVPETFHKPYKRKKPTTYFVCSMGDFAHIMPLIYNHAVLEVIEECPRHTFLILTKRPDRLGPIMQSWYNHHPRILPNLYLGVTICNQDEANHKIPQILKIPAARRFLSIEPMLGPIDLARGGAVWSDMNDTIHPEYQQPGKHIDQVILGGESGPGARPMHPDWPREIRDQCHAAGVPFFFKQWGAWAEGWSNVQQCRLLNGTYMTRLGKKRAGRLLDGKTHDQLIWRTDGE